MKKPVALSIILLGFAALSVLFSQDANTGFDRNALMARDEFRRGILAYNRYGFNEALLSFEKALSYKPAEPLILEWLGRAYYRSGLEETALRQWQEALRLYPAGSKQSLLLTSYLETIRNRRALFFMSEDQIRFVESGRYPAKQGGMFLYRQPSAVLPLPDGSVWVVAYGSNEILRIDVNGVIKQRVRGPLNGFDRPYDIARSSDGRLFVSEYRGGRISVLDSQGNWKAYVGTKGRGPGQFIGPQNICIDGEDYLYVVDFGTQRISKFTPDGTYLFSFGAKGGDFPGFRAPTGIAAIEDQVFVADQADRTIYRFDKSGNYLGPAIQDGLTVPEALRPTREGKLIVADGTKILLASPDTGFVQPLASLGNAGGRVLGADFDQNGSLLAANFQAEEVTVLNRTEDMASGLFVQIERVIADKFPLVTIDVQVQDRHRRPIVGLDARNFLITEGGKPVLEQSFTGAAYLSNTAAISLVLERSPNTTPLQTELQTAVKDSVAAADRLVSLVSAGEIPVKERIDSAAALQQSAKGSAVAYSPRWRFDLALRLAATDLLPVEKKRALVFVGSGRLGQKAFDTYGLSELASYMANNGIAFYTVIVGNGVADKELQYLCDQTGGQVLRLYQNQGIGPALRQIRQNPAGSYTLQYRSQLPTDFGRAFLPVEAEVYLLERSGRDALGYFAPLQ
ncbi:MAG: 6-bladed beta-propeller [Treponema sp.]|nr:6-bladed beta-propeller [Treponema sp.]